MMAFLNDEPGADVVEDLLEKAKDGVVDVATNKINLLGIYFGIFREDGIETADSIIKIIESIGTNHRFEKLEIFGMKGA